MSQSHQNRSTRWTTGKELIERWGIKNFELFDFLKQGLQPYTSHGTKIVDSDSLERAPRDSLETIERNLRAKEHARALGSGPSSGRGPRTEGEIKAIARKIYESQSLEIINPHKDCVLMSFNLPLNEIKARQTITRAMGFLFKMDEVVEFERKYNLYELNKDRKVEMDAKGLVEPKYDDADDKSNIGQIKNHETFIRNLIISYENNSEIKIQEPGRPSKTYNYTALDFQDEKTKAWRIFLKILQEPDYTYNVGKAHIGKKQRNQSYDARQKTLLRINKKLISFLNKHYPVRIPEDFKLYELCPDKKQGTYRFKFRRVTGTSIIEGTIADKYRRLTKDKLLAKLKKDSKEYVKISNSSSTDRNTQTDRFINEFHIAAKIALEKKWIAKDKLSNMVQLDTHEEDIEYSAPS